jgi:hypothetical protein
VTPDFFGDLGDSCGRKGGTTPSSGDSIQLSPASSCGGGGAH